jgi:hypothetical protein
MEQMSGASNAGSGASGGMGAQPGAQGLTLHYFNDMPELFKRADQASIKARAAFFTWMAAELTLLSLAAAAALFAVFKTPEIPFGPLDYTLPPILGATRISITELSYAGLISGLFAVSALAVRFYRNAKHFDTQWYEARAAAESAKSIAWRYAVGGRPFPLGGDETATDRLLVQRLDDTLADVAHDLKQLTTTFTPDQNITPAMRQLRITSLATRQAAYDTGRLLDQEKWYQGKVNTLTRIAQRWHWVLVAIEFIGTLGALAIAAHLITFNIQSVAGAVASAIISWVQAQRYTDLAASYGVTRSELSSIREGVQKQTTDGQWSTFVDEAEEACSREHRLWRATRDADPV